MFKKTNQLINDITYVLIGVLLGASYLLLWMKVLGIYGFPLGVVSVIAYKIYLSRSNKKFDKHYQKFIFKGVFWFSIFISIAALIVFFIFYSALQNLIS